MTQTGKMFWITWLKGDQFRPAIAYLASKDRYLVAWRGRIGGNPVSFGRLVESNTALKGADLDISSGAPVPGGPNASVLGHVAVAFNEAQKVALVVWSQGGAGLLSSDIYGRFVDPDGNFPGAPFKINTPADPAGYDTCIRVAWNAKTNQFLVVWEAPNDVGWQMPYGAILNASGTRVHAVMIGERNKAETYSLRAVAANPNTGQWLVAFDKYCRSVDFDGTLGDLSTPPPMENVFNIYDAFAVPAGYIVIGTQPFMWNQVMVWGATLSADGKVFGPLNHLESSVALEHARAAFIPKSKEWLVFASLHHDKKLPPELWCRKFDLQFADLEGKPYGVIDERYYELNNGYAAHAVNTSNTETCVVWSHRSNRFGTIRNSLAAVIVESQPGIIVVQDENNVPVPGAYVWVNDALAGFTNASGWLKCKLKTGDRIAARMLAFSHPSVKAGHDSYGGSWAYHVWLTSVEIRPDGSAPVWTVSDTSQPQVLTVRKTNTLIGFNVVVSTSWSASQSDLDQIKQLIHDASNRLYNATDGQLYVEHVGLNGSDKAWSEADMRVLNNTGRADTTNNVSMQDSYMQMYRLGQGGSVDSGTYVHELLHYLAFLDDEYEDDAPRDAMCTHKLASEAWGSGPFAPGGTRSSCPMSGAGPQGPWKLCTSLAENPHNKRVRSGPEPCWDVLYRIYTNSSWVSQSGRWQLVQPTDRRAILPGPASLPCPGWMTVDNPTSRAYSGQRQDDPGLQLSPFPSMASSLKSAAARRKQVDLTIRVADQAGRPAQADLWLEHDFGVRRLGRTDPEGLIRLPSDAAGKTVWATCCTTQDGNLLAARMAVRQRRTPQGMTLRPQGSPLSIRLRPSVSPRLLEIFVEAPGILAQPPLVTATPDGVQASTLVPLAWDAQRSCFRGEFVCEQGRHEGGVICVTVGRGAEAESVALVEYQLVQVAAGATCSLPAGDGYAMLALGRQTAAGTLAMLTRAALPQPLPPGAELVGGPYELASTTRFLDGVICMVPFAEVSEVDGEALQVLRWQANAPEWVAMPTFWHPGERYVGGGIDITGAADPRGVYAAVRQLPK